MSEPVSVKTTIVNRLGLHARPAMMFVEIASEYEAEVKVRRCDQDEVVDGKSIMQLMMLAATEGTALEITAQGADAQKAISSLTDLIKSKFSEADS